MYPKIMLYNTLTRSVDEFVPITEGKVGMYTCGPTVYNYAHIGNLRTFIFEDVLKKMFKRAGYEVCHVMNITDVGHLSDDADSGEDKMEKAAQKEKKSVWDIAKFYTDAFFKDEEELNIQKADYIPRATDHINEILALIKRLEDNGYTYTANGNVYFSIDKFPTYGELAQLDKQKLNAGERVEIDENKKNPHDFVLWFTKSKFKNQSMLWPSPYGTGYPGWHIECSAMSMKYLGEHFDIHCGGIDAIPVHHTNEIAQSEGATGHKWVNCWMHGEFLLSEKGKMSKSSGTFLTLGVLKDNGFDPLAYRYFVLGCHYRKQLQFSYEALSGAQNALNRLRSAVREIAKNAQGQIQSDSKALEAYTNEFNAALYSDMNMPVCLAVLQKVVKDKNLPDVDKCAFIRDTDRVLSLSLTDILDGKEKQEAQIIPDEIKDLAEKRLEAKKQKDYQQADSIRNKILSLGYSIKDTPQGYEISKL